MHIHKSQEKMYILGLNADVGDLHILDDHGEALGADSTHADLGEIWREEVRERKRDRGGSAKLCHFLTSNP